MRMAKTAFMLLFLALGMVPSALAQTEGAALPYPRAGTPRPIDRGEFTAESETTRVSVTLALGLPDLKAAESLMKSLYAPGDAQFHRFLTPAEFAARFAPADADVAKVIAALEKYGLKAQRTTATTLKVTGLSADVERAFSVSLHSYEVPAQGNIPGYTYHAPLGSPMLPAEISVPVAGVVGLDTRPSLHPLHKLAPTTLRKSASPRPSARSSTTFWPTWTPRSATY